MAYLSAIHDLQIINAGGTATLHSASGALGGVTSFGLQTGWQAQFQTQTAYAVNTTSYTYVPFASGTVQLSLTRLADMLSEADTATSGSAAGTPIFIRNNGFTGDLVTMLAVDLPGGTCVYAGLNGSSGITAFQLSGTATLTALAVMADTGTLPLADVSALVSVRVGGATLLVSASSGENGLASFVIASDGSLTQADVLDSRHGLSVSQPSAMKAVMVDGESYLVLAAAGSSSLSVVKLRADGQMQVVDHIIDSLDTRFGGACVVETVTAGDRTFVLAAGNDDGLSLFTLLPGGRLLLIDTLADGASLLLDNVAAITAAVVGTEVQIFTSSQTEAGICQFRIDLATLGPVQTGTPQSDSLTGTGLDDLLAGDGGADHLFGGLGNDILLDGAGSDQMTGGQGADIFVLSYDGQSDAIMDFQPGIDLLDLSGWPMFYAAGQATLTPTVDGCVLQFGAEQLVLTSMTHSPLTIADFPLSALVAMSRQAGLLEGRGVRLAGTTGSDFQIGASGNDVMFGSTGADWIMGGNGRDTVRFNDQGLTALLPAAGAVRVDLKHPDRNIGLAAGDEYDGIEQFFGTQGDDVLAGSGGVNRFSGGNGDDALIGRGGADQLDGQNGGDQLTGGGGGDLLSGGGGADAFIYRQPGDSDTRPGSGDIIADFTGGQDVIRLAAVDADTLAAGNQAFRFIGAAGFSGQAGELRFSSDTTHNRTLIQIDVDGNGRTDMQIELTGLIALTAGDFIL